jgi:hypothetical protein
MKVKGYMYPQMNNLSNFVFLYRTECKITYI